MFRSFPAPSQQELHEHVMLTAYVAEFAEWDNRAHLERIRRYSSILARESELEQDEAGLISSASVLHDIGKIALPATLLKKTANLTPDEYRIAEKHTVEGGRLLSGSSSPLLQAAGIISRTHHERWDGSGYPEGLRGNAIPLSGRIMALADVFDALTTKRPYKAAIQPEAAFELIKSSSGTLFDPALVSIFVEKLEDFRNVLRITDKSGGD